MDIVQTFINWTKNKIQHEVKKQKDIYFYEREIWWVALGKNVGFEIDGKHENFERPVYILRVFSRDLCLVLPCTTKNIPEAKYLFNFEINNKKMAVNFSQSRTISSKRLLRKMGRLESTIGLQIKNNFLNYIK